MIVAVREGQVVETGTHDELMALDGLYSSLVRVQVSRCLPCLYSHSGQAEICVTTASIPKLVGSSLAVIKHAFQLAGVDVNSEYAQTSFSPEYITPRHMKITSSSELYKPTFLIRLCYAITRTIY